MEKDTKAKAKATQKQYEEALAIDKEKIAALLRAPNLFHWFIGLNSIVSGSALFLYSRITEDFAAGKFSSWLIPIQIALILGGVGLLLSELSEKTTAVWRGVFRLVLAGSYAALALIWWNGGKFDGVFIALWLSLSILFNVVADLSSLRSFLVFYQGLLIGLLLIIFYYPNNTIVGNISSRYAAGSSMVLSLSLLILIAYIAASWWSYFIRKRASAIFIGAASVPLATLAFVYANVSAWIGAFILLVTAIFAVLLPFWDEVAYRLEKQRVMVVRMFGVLLGLFLLTILLIRVLQNILITNTFSFLSDKVTYGKISADSTVTSSIGAVRALATNDVFAQAVARGNEDELVEFSRTFFESNRSMLRIMAVDVDGKILSAYPLTVGVVGESVADQPYFTNMVVSEELYVSDVVAPSLELGARTIAISVPVMRNNVLVGGAIGFLDLTSLSDRLQEVATPQAGEYFVVLDKAGTWVVGPEEAEERFGDPLVDILMQRGNLGQGYAKNGLLTLTASSEMESTGWRMIVAQPLFAALAVNQTAYLIVLALVSISVVTVGLTILAEREVEREL